METKQLAVMVHCSIHTLEGVSMKATPTAHQTPKGSRFGFPKAAHQFWRPNVIGRQLFADVVSHTVRLLPKGLRFENSEGGLTKICPDSAMEITCTVKAKDLAM